MTRDELLIREAILKIREKERELACLVIAQNASRRPEFMAAERRACEARIEELTVAIVEEAKR